MKHSKRWFQKSFGRRDQGFVLLDVVFALFLFTLGFTALYGLTEGAIHETQQALNFTEAANTAQNLMEDLSAHSWSENLTERRCIPGENVEGENGRFSWRIFSDWETPGELLKIQVTVIWKENGRDQSYSLDTLFSMN
jgi:hypothetical protein